MKKKTVFGQAKQNNNILSWWLEWHPLLLTRHLLFCGGNEQFEDIEGGIRSRKSEKDSQHNEQKKKDKRTNGDLQNTKQQN